MKKYVDPKLDLVLIAKDDIFTTDSGGSAVAGPGGSNGDVDFPGNGLK